MTEIAAHTLPTIRITIPPITEVERTSAMEALAPILDRYGDSLTRVPRADLARASTVLLRAHAHAGSDGHRERWRGLPASEFDQGCLDALRPLAVGCREVRAAVTSWDAHTSRAQIPLALATEASEVKQRVMRYVSYQLGEEPGTAREIASIRSGTGYLDLESDLRRLAVLLQSHQALLATDRFYQNDDAATCVRLADAIGAELATDAAAPSDWITRIHVAIHRCYHREVAPTAAWLYRHTPSDLAFYTSPYAAGRARAATPTDAAPEDSDIPPETVPSPEADA